MGKRKKQPQQQQTLFDLKPYTHQPGYWEMEDEDVFSDDYMNRAMLYLESKPKSTPVARDSVERVYFLDREVSGETTPSLNDKSTPVARDSVQRVYFLDREVSGETTPSLNDKSTPVARDSVQRVYFWVETYLMHQRYLHYRFCHIHREDGIDRVVKVHIPGRGMSVREGRAQLVREAIADGKTLVEIEALIQGWRV